MHLFKVLRVVSDMQSYSIWTWMAIHFVQRLEWHWASFVALMICCTVRLSQSNIRRTQIAESADFCYPLHQGPSCEGASLQFLETAGLFHWYLITHSSTWWHGLFVFDPMIHIKKLPVFPGQGLHMRGSSVSGSQQVPAALTYMTVHVQFLRLEVRLESASVKSVGNIDPKSQFHQWGPSVKQPIRRLNSVGSWEEGMEKPA